jgi:hypothetical protein
MPGALVGKLVIVIDVFVDSDSGFGQIFAIGHPLASSIRHLRRRGILGPDTGC